MKLTCTFKRSIKNGSALGKKVLFPFFALLFFFTKLDAQYIDIEFTPTTTNTTPSGNFQVIVKAHFLSANPLNAIETHFTFDITKLQATAITNLSAVVLPNIAISPSFNNTTGTVDFAAGTASGFPTADFNLYSIDFTVLPAAASGSTSLAFNTTTTLAAAPGGIDILNSTVNGTVIITGVGCTPPSATISAPGGTITCNGQAFNLSLATAPVGTAPFDITIDGPGGTATFDNIAVGGVITNFIPPVEKIWPDPINPVPPTNEDAAYTLGVKFTSSVNGFVKGVRFFSPDEVVATAGNYTGQLWTLGGTLLASGTFTGVTADSWNELLFTTPVLITAGTTYIASYNTNASLKYASTANGLLSAVTNGSLTALANGGVYNTGSAVVFPSVPPIGGTTNHNYWVDVLFSSNAYTFNLTGVKDANECISTGALQTLNVTSVDCNTLPVSLLNLSATPKDNTITLTWSTASELNNLGFEIQRRTDASEWSVIGFVNGAGNSSITRHYSHADENLESGRYYYRLKQVDIDGRFEFSPVVSAILGGAESARLDQNFPNPFSNETTLRFAIPQKTNVKLSLFDMHGRLIRILVNGSREKGTHAVTFNASTLNSGVYFYKLETDNFTGVKKMTIQ